MSAGLQVPGRECEWEELWGVGHSQTGDAKGSMEPRPPALLCQESGWDSNLQGSRVFTLLIKLI